MSEQTKTPLLGGKALSCTLVVLALVAAAGIGLWVMQLSGGLVQTGMRNISSWGLYIMGFMWFVGLSAGGLIISSVPRVLGIKGFGGISKIAIWTSIACTCCAVGLILVDLGNPLRIWELFVYSNLGSPLMWDVLVIGTYLVLSIVYLVLCLRNEAGKISDGAVRLFSAVCLVVAVLVHTVTAWIIGLQISHELWATALMGPWFVCSALVSGTALVMVVCFALRKAGLINLAQENVVKMAKWLGAFCLVDLYFFGCDLLTSGWSGGEGAAVVDMLLFGQMAPFFWTEVVLTVACAVVCLTPALRTTPLLCAGAVAGMVAILCKRVQLVAGGFQIANIAHEGMTGDYALAQPAVSLTQALGDAIYAPTAMELGILIGVCALGAFIFLIGLRYLNILPTAQSH